MCQQQQQHIRLINRLAERSGTSENGKTFLEERTLWPSFLLRDCIAWIPQTVYFTSEHILFFTF